MSLLTTIRPCNSYDLFFRLEKEYILQILRGYRPTIASDDVFDPEADDGYAGPPLPSRYGGIILPRDWYVRERVLVDDANGEEEAAFARDPAMASRISEAWAAADDEIRIYCAAASAALSLPKNCVSNSGENQSSKRKNGGGGKSATGTRKRCKGKDSDFDLDVSDITTITPSDVDSNHGFQHGGRRCSAPCPSESSSLSSVQSSSSSVIRCNINGYNDDDGRRRSDPISWDDLDDAIEAGRRRSIEDLAQSTSSNGDCASSVRPQEEEISWDDLNDHQLKEGLRRSLEDLSDRVVERQEQGLRRFSSRRDVTVCKEVRFDLS